MLLDTWKYFKASLTMREPCRRCLVRAACNNRCDEKIRYDQMFSDIGRVWYFFTAVSVLIAVITVLIRIFITLKLII